ncbi:MAG: N-acetyltransferase [Nitrospiraceae bacterium]|nr:MAG: N-acetyltransferase [Nitrospiraceae bacterium]
MASGRAHSLSSIAGKSGRKHKSTQYTFGKATLNDAKAIHALVNSFAQRNRMLPRSLNDIYELIRDFYVCRDRDTIVAVCALHIVWENLAEIRSIAVMKKYQKRGLGRKLIQRCLREAKVMGARSVFALTYFPEYFKKLGFEDIDKNELPHKIWGDCLKCPKFPDCEELAVIKRLDSPA